MKTIDVKTKTYTDSWKMMMKILDLKLVIMWEYQKYKNIFAKRCTPNWLEKVFIIKEVKNTVPWTYLISDHNGQGIFEAFYEKEMQTTNQTEFRIEKVIKKDTKLYVIDIYLYIIYIYVYLYIYMCVCVILIYYIYYIYVKDESIFPRPYQCSGGNVNV